MERLQELWQSIKLSPKYESAGKVWNVAKQFWLIYMLLGGVITALGLIPDHEPNFITDLGQVIWTLGFASLMFIPFHFLDRINISWVYYRPAWAKGLVLTKRGFLFIFAITAVVILIGVWAFFTGSRINWSEYVIVAYAAFLFFRTLVRTSKDVFNAMMWSGNGSVVRCNKC